MALLAVACSGKGDTIIQTSGPISGITVSGTGKATGTPDLAVIQLGVQAQRDSVEDARSAAAGAMQKVIDSLKGNGLKDDDIQTVQFSIYPQYDYNNNNKQTLTGYQVSNVVTAKIHKLDTAGKVIDDAAQAGGNDVVVQSISFTFNDPTDLQNKARTDAVKQAKARAQQLADDAGVGLGKLLSVDESASGGQRDLAIPATGSFSQAAPLTPIQTGELEISVTVNLVYAVD
jgi:uncharacterized protein YggE